jgi:hypothetical protein
MKWIYSRDVDFGFEQISVSEVMQAFFLEEKEFWGVLLRDFVERAEDKGSGSDSEVKVT